LQGRLVHEIYLPDTPAHLTEHAKTPMKTQDLPDISAETYAVHNSDGSVSLDPYARKTRLELKNRCGELCHALDDWQWIAMTLSTNGRDALSSEQIGKLDGLIEAYKD
jgi:hypothetical protein